MTKGVLAPAMGIVTLLPGQRVWFYSCETALVDVTFPAGTWDVVYRVIAWHAADVGRGIFTRIHSINAAGKKLSPAEGYKEGIETIKHLGLLQEIDAFGGKLLRRIGQDARF